jgi:hypothetical protein
MGNPRFRIAGSRRRPFLPCFHPKAAPPECIPEGRQFRDPRAALPKSP